MGFYLSAGGREEGDRDMATLKMICRRLLLGGVVCGALGVGAGLLYGLVVFTLTHLVEGIVI